MPDANRQTKPAPEAWSVAEVLEHLSIVETNISGMLAKKIAEGRDAGIGPETDTSPVVNPRHGETMRDRSRRIVSGEGTRPTSSLTSDAAWAAAERARETLRQVIIDADGLALGELSAPHRVFGSLNVYEWIAFVGNHESRHAAQIREIGSSLEGRRS